MTVKSLSKPGAIRRLLKTLAAGLLPALLAGWFALPLAAATPSNVVNARVDAMDRMAVALKALLGRNAAQTSNVVLRRNTEILKNSAARLLSMFPSGSGTGQTNARPEIWTNWPAFVSRATELQLETNRLTQALERGTVVTVADQAKLVSHACASCHQDFRNEPN